MAKVVRVQKGDCIHSIAFANGFFPDTIWNLPENAELAQLRKDPFVLQPGDEVAIPDLRPRAETVATGQRHRFVRRGIPLCVRIQLLLGDCVLADAPVDVEIDGVHHELVSDADGWLEIPITPTARRCVLTLEDGDSFELALGHLDPIDSVAGVQGRLQIIGFHDGAIDGEMGAHTVAALQRFQLAHGLEPTGEADEATRTKLQELTRR